jgi:hypothetical protein|tara:strand:+ start:1353 stop:1604 length:252 start_codon:yes stop_codon:yes gene_type:complete
MKAIIPAIITDDLMDDYEAATDKFLVIIDACQTSVTAYDNYPAVQAAVDQFEDRVEADLAAANAPDDTWEHVHGPTAHWTCRL